MQRLPHLLAKICDRATLARRCAGWRNVSRRVVFTNGVFDLLHRGHLHYLAAAAGLGNALVVGVNSDLSVRRLGKGEDRPVTQEEDRLFALASLHSVDAVCLFEEDTPAGLIEAVRPDVLVKGGDYSAAQIVGADFVQDYGGTVETIPFLEGYSTTALIQKLRA